MKTIEQIRDEESKKYTLMDGPTSYKIGFNKRGKIDKKEIKKLKEEIEILEHQLEEALECI